LVGGGHGHTFVVGALAKNWVRLYQIHIVAWAHEHSFGASNISFVGRAENDLRVVVGFTRVGGAPFGKYDEKTF